MRILIVGGSGQLGRALWRSRPSTHDVRALGREELHIEDAAAVTDAIDRERPDVVINAAAYTNVDRAEQERDRAFAVNAEGAGNLAAAVAASGGAARMIHVSTDYVFDGAGGTPYLPDAEPRPINAYGASKLEGERAVIAACGEAATIVRTSWLYDAEGRNFLATILRKLREGATLRVVDDQIGSPTAAATLASALWRAVELPRCSGVLHWTDSGVASWYDFAVAIQEEGSKLGLAPRGGEIRAVPSSEYPTAARRPSFSVLDKVSTREALGLEPPHWRVALREVLGRVDSP